MEGCGATSDALGLGGFSGDHPWFYAGHQDLYDFHADGDIELFAGGDQSMNVVQRGHVVLGGAEAGTEKFVIEMFADYRVVAAAELEKIVAPPQFQSCRVEPLPPLRCTSFY